MEPVGRFFQLLWRHRIVQVGAAYLVAGWGAFQVVAALTSTLRLAEWAPKMTLVLLGLGFPLAMVFAWAWPTRKADSAETAAKPVKAAPKPVTEGGTIAVLPFANFSREEADEVFADGMVEDLITSLSLNSSFIVISRSSTFAYKGQSPDVREVARDLGADFVLEGSVRRVGERLRVTAQLIEAETGGHLWAEKYDRPLAELFDLQDDLVLAIAAALGAELARAELKRVRENPTSLSAWEEAMRSAQLYERPRLAGLPVAIAHARKAVELDPNFAMAQVRLGLALATKCQMLGEGPGSPGRIEAYDHLQKSISLAPNDARILGIAASAMAHIGHAEEGLRHGLRSLELNPHDAVVHGSVGNALMRGGRPAEALPYYDAEERLAPRSIWLNGRYLYRGLAWLALEKPDEARAAFSRSATADPQFEQAWCALAAVEAVRGDWPAAREAITRLRELNPKAPLEVWVAALTTAVTGPLSAAAIDGFRKAWAEAAPPA